MTRDALAILNRAFVRVYRSFGQYLLWASPHWDAGADVIERVLLRQADDADRLGKWIASQYSSLVIGNFPAAYSDLHFLTSSRLLADWKAEQKKLIADLQSDRAALADFANEPGVQILDETIEHEKDTLAQLEKLKPLPALT